jgi:hypothetical protein
MKQLRNYLLLALLTFVGSAYGEGLKVSDFTIDQGGTYDLAVELDDPASQYIMTDFWISLPSGVTIAKDGNGDFLAEKSDRFGQTHSFSISEGEGNAYHVLIYSSQNKPLAGNDAWLLKLKLEASENATAGESQGKIFSQKITDAERNNLTPADATFKVTVQEASVVETDYFLVGSMNEWTPSDNYKLTANKESTGEYMITLDFAAGAEFKIVKGQKEVWYPEGENNNCTINDAGNYTVYFRPDYSGGDDWFHKCIYVASNGVEPGTKFSEQVAAAIAAVEDGGTATVTMTKDEILDATINVPLNKELVIDGANKILTLGAETNFVLNDNITLKDVKIDATELTVPLIALTAAPAEGTKKNQDVYNDAASTDFNLLNSVTIENVMVKNLKSSLITSNGADWALENFTMTKSIIQLDVTGKNFIAFDKAANNKSAIKNITISENTIYNINETSNAYFVRFANASNAAKAFGTNNGTSTFDFKLTKNTIINTFKEQNFGNNTPNNAKTEMTGTQNIYVDLKNLSKFFQGNCTKTIEKNVSWGGTEEATMSESIEPAFTAPTAALDLTAENGGIDLTIAASSKAAEYQSGDPRWVVPYVEPQTEPTEFYIMGTGTDNGWSGTTAMTLNSETNAFEYEATLTGESYITFGDAAFTANGDESWSQFNGVHRYAIGEGNVTPTLGEAVQLVKVNDGNIQLTTPGKYLFSVSKDLKLTVTRTGDAPVEEADYYLTGTMTNWSQAAADLANYKLALKEGAEGVEYVIKNVAFEADAKFKVIKIKEGEETTWYPGGSDNDYVIQTAGDYDVYFRPNADGGQDWHEGYIYATASSTSTLDKSALEAEIATATALLGDASTEDGTPGKTLADAIAAAQQALQTATTQDEIDAAVQTLKDAEEAYKAATTPEADYYLTGTMTGWSTVAADLANYKLARNEGAQGVVEYMIKNVAFEASAQFKVIKVEEGKDPIWYPTGMDNNYTIQNAGNYDVYFRPNKDGGEDWHEGYIYATLPLDKSALETEIATATELLGDASTEDGTPGKALADAIAAAQDALQNATTQDEINNALQALKDAEEAYKTATGIAGLYLGKYADGEWYTIQGVRIDRPTTKGLYIRNGRTVVVK